MPFLKSLIVKLLFFISLYCIVSFILIPPIAKKFGRVRLPLNSAAMESVTAFTFIANRNYVKPKLLSSLEQISIELKKENPNIKIGYLDACFPLYNGFPLFPHLSHNDGQKIDLAFYYKEIGTNSFSNNKPAKSGYGAYVNPQVNEMDKTRECKSKGNLIYDFSKYLTFGIDENLQFDENETKKLLTLLVNNQDIKKVLLEPHLKHRLGFEGNPKVRFQGCHSVRHDDHIHVELK